MRLVLRDLREANWISRVGINCDDAINYATVHYDSELLQIMTEGYSIDWEYGCDEEGKINSFTIYAYPTEKYAEILEAYSITDDDARVRVKRKENNVWEIWEP